MVEMTPIKLSAVRTFVETWFSLTDVPPILYANPNIISILKQQGDLSFLAPCPLWLAHYGVSKPSVPSPWSKWTFWQTGIALGPEYPKKIDRDLYNGNYDQLWAQYGFIPDW